jgi:hypothetical protein
VAQMTDPEPTGGKVGKPRWLQILLGITWVFFLFAVSLLLIAIAVRDDILHGKLLKLDQATTLLFGASTISLGALALLAGGFALFGWGYLKENVKKEVEESLRERIRTVEQELRGRSRTVLGYVIGENSVIVTEEAELAGNKERLREAIQHCEEAYLLLKGSGLPVEFTALNNYLYYSCVLGDTSSRDTILDRARRLREAAIEHNSQNLLMTYARTVLTFSHAPGQIVQACEFVADIKRSSTLNEKQKREANYLASLCEKSDPGVAVTGNKER